MNHLTRRSIFRSAALTASATAIKMNAAHAADRAGTRYNFGHTVDFGEQYYLRITEMLENIRRNELGHIGDITSRMADSVKSGGTVWLQAVEGHMGRFDSDETLPGMPGIIRSIPGHKWNEREKEICGKLKKGDVLVTNHVNEPTREARDRGAHVISVPICYVDSEFTPREYARPNVNGWLLGDVASEILQSYVPYTQGVVDCPQIPEVRMMPSSSNAMFTLFWMLQCGTADKAKNRRANHVATAQTVIDTIIERMHEGLRLQRDHIWNHAATAAKQIGNGGHFHVSTDPLGVQEESNRVANGPMMTNAHRRIVRFDGTVIGENDMRAGDVHLVACVEPDAPKILAEAKKAKEMGMFVVAIAPGNSYELRNHTDCFIDNLSPEGAGLLDIKGYDKKVGTVGNILNNTIMWVFTSQMVDEMVRHGWIPWFYLGYHQIGGVEYDRAVKPFFVKQGF